MLYAYLFQFKFGCLLKKMNFLILEIKCKLTNVLGKFNEIQINYYPLESSFEYLIIFTAQN